MKQGTNIMYNTILGFKPEVDISVILETFILNLVLRLLAGHR